MFKLRNPKDGRIHWSDLKRMSECPAIARHSLEHPKPPTDAMRLGSAVDAIVFRTSEVHCYADRRAGKEWEAFRSQRTAAIILNEAEYACATGAADAVLTDPVSAPLLIGQHQVVAQWDAHGLPFAAGIAGERGGFDVLGSEHIADLKITSTTKPGPWEWHAKRMLYFHQITLYADAARSLGHYPNKAHIIGVSAKAPHVVTVLTASDAMMDQCRKTIAMWCEQVLSCERSGHWPGYVQSAVTVEPTEFEFTDTEDD